VIDPADVARLSRAIDCVREDTAADLLERMGGPARPADRTDPLSTECEFAHVAVLVFPDAAEDVAVCLRHHGLHPREPIASTVVKHRLARRYGLDAATLPVTIVSAPVEGRGGGSGGEIEVFVLPGLVDRTTGSLADRERRGEHESHFALAVREPDEQRVAGVLRAATERYGLVPDGGGHNPHERADHGGRSVFYFEHPTADSSGHRLEVAAAGHHRGLLSAHARETAQHDDARQTRLLELVAGYWGSRAVQTTAGIGLADVLGDAPLTLAQAATGTGCDPDALGRLLRYLVGLGLVTVNDGRYSSTSTLSLLRRGNPFHDLALLYGHEFYDAWGEFEHALQTGNTAFSRAFGLEHFDYFRTRPELSRRFDRAMAATTTAIADGVAAYDFREANCIVDVGGGNGTLLASVLRANPQAAGVLVEQAHVLDSLVEPDQWPHDRVTTVAASFFDEVPEGGDIYLLARILHDWDDEDCRSILRACRKAMATDTKLMVVERVLPDEPAPSLAGLWDLQMLAVTGGRERTLGHYGRLFADTGFTFRISHPLRLGLSLLVAEAV